MACIVALCITIWVVVVMLTVTAYVCQTGQYHYTDDNMAVYAYAVYHEACNMPCIKRWHNENNML